MRPSSLFVAFDEPPKPGAHCSTPPIVVFCARSTAHDDRRSHNEDDDDDDDYDGNRDAQDERNRSERVLDADNDDIDDDAAAAAGDDRRQIDDGRRRRALDGKVGDAELCARSSAHDGTKRHKTTQTTCMFLSPAMAMSRAAFRRRFVTYAFEPLEKQSKN